MNPTDGRAAATDLDPGLSPEVKAHLVRQAVGEEGAWDGDFAARRVSDNELLERTPNLARAIEVADDFGEGAYVMPCWVKPGDPLALGLDPAVARELATGAALFADRTTLAQVAERAPNGSVDTQAKLDAMIFEMGVEKTGLPLVVVQESIYREACRLGRES